MKTKDIKAFSVFLLLVLTFTLVNCGESPVGDGPGTLSGYRVVFHVGEGRGVPPFPQTVAPGNIIELPTQEAMEHAAGKVLTGWNDGRTTYPIFYRYTVNSDVAFIAQWGTDPGGPGTPVHTHVWGPWIVTTPPTLTQNGVETRTCTLDPSHKETRSIPATGSDGGAGTPGLAYALNATATAYSVSKGTVTSGAVVIPATYNGLPVTEISNSGFDSCRAISSVSIPTSITTIGKWAFNWCVSLTSIAIPSSVTSIPEYAFYSCTGLTSVSIPSSVTSIGMNAFSGCESLTSVTIPSSVKTIGSYAFNGCTSLTSFTIPGGMTSLENGVIRYCKSITSFIIPSSITSIGVDVFRGCTGISSIVIPSTVTKVGEWAFKEWTASQTIYVEGHISPAVADIAWGRGWHNDCNAAIKYWNGTAWL